MSAPARSALAAIVAGALAALLLPGVPAGIGYVIVAGALAVAAGFAIGPGQRPRSAALGTLAVALALSAALRDASWVVAGELAAAIVLGSIAMSVPRGWRATGLAAIAAPSRSPSGALGIVRAALDGVPSASGARALAVGRGLLLAAALVVVFGALFATGDRAFAQIADDALPGRLPLDDLALRVLVFAFVVALAGGIVRAAAVVDTPARPVLLRIGPVEWRLALIALNLLFALFVAVQVAVLFGGDGYVRETAGLTYAEYARSGFAQLVLVALLTLAVVAASLRWARADGRRAERLLRVLLVALCLLTLVVLASALHRLGLYERAFGFTRTRLAVHALLLFGGALFILVVIGLAAGRRTWLPRATVALAAVAALAFWVSDPDRRIAAHNVERYEATGRIDVDYLDQLSADAVPELARLPAVLRSRALRSQRARLESTGDGFGGANRSRARARQVIVVAVP